MSNAITLLTGFVGIVLVVLGMVFLYLKVVPKKYDGTFKNKALQFVHDYFNFKKLYIESVLKFIFTLFTVIFIAAGVVGVLSSFLGIFENLSDVFQYGMPFWRVITSFFTGLITSILTMVIGPVAVRLTYEGIMMFILLVKNVIEINNKTKAHKEEKTEE